MLIMSRRGGKWVQFSQRKSTQLDVHQGAVHFIMLVTFTGSGMAAEVDKNNVIQLKYSKFQGNWMMCK